MDVRIFLWAFTLLPVSVFAAGMPSYTADGVVNAASGTATISTGTLVTVFGENLSFDTVAIGPEHLRAGTLPTKLAGTSVFLDTTPVGLYYVSPTQINFLVSPTITTAKEATLRIINESRSGPEVTLKLSSAAPGLFLSAQGVAVGTRADGSVVTQDNPIHSGEIVVLYATGLGVTNPTFGDLELPNRPALIKRAAEFRVELDGTVLDPSAVFYVGVTPGFAGLYQINLRLPAHVGDDPEIRIGFEGQMSPSGVKLPLKSPPVDPQ